MFKRYKNNKSLKVKITFVLLFLAACIFLYQTTFKTLTINPLSEKDAVVRLELVKQNFELSEFISDGCSGNVSNLWSGAVIQLSDMFPFIESQYADVQDIPFEYACIVHDKAYHQGVGGYATRLLADNALREAIILYGIENSGEIKKRMNIESDEVAMLLYESIAEIVYRGVRLGGVPCTGKPYAWGYGYNMGVCDNI